MLSWYCEFYSEFFRGVANKLEGENMLLDSQSPMIEKIKEEIIKVKEMQVIQNNILEILMAEFDRKKEEHGS